MLSKITNTSRYRVPAAARCPVLRSPIPSRLPLGPSTKRLSKPHRAAEKSEGISADIVTDEAVSTEVTQTSQSAASTATFKSLILDKEAASTATFKSLILDKEAASTATFKSLILDKEAASTATFKSLILNGEAAFTATLELLIMD
eukprot:gene26794-4384_t